MRASGSSGVLRVGYQVAATLGAWSLVLEHRLPRVFTLRAAVLTEHAHWITQRPIDLVVHLASVEWIWRDIALERDGQDIVVHVTERPIVEPCRVTAGGEKVHG